MQELILSVLEAESKAWKRIYHRCLIVFRSGSDDHERSVIILICPFAIVLPIQKKKKKKKNLQTLE